MTALNYTCTTLDGNTIVVNSYAEAEAIKAKGGIAKVTYAKIDEPFKVSPNRYEKLKEKGAFAK